MTSSRPLLLPAVLLGLGLAAGCGGQPDEAANVDSSTAPQPTTTSSAPQDPVAPQTEKSPQAPAAPTAEAPSVSKNAYAARCGSTGTVRTAIEQLKAKTGAVTDPAGSKMPVTVAGRGSTALVVLHGSDGDACDAQQFLAAAGADKRFRVIAVDLCTSKVAVCVGEMSIDDAAQTSLVLETVREQYDPAKVVLVGVGSGGSTAVRAAGVGVPADAVVNVSGKAAAADVRRVTVPMLHLYDDPSGAAASGARIAAGESHRQVVVADAPASGWAALTGRGADLTGAGRKALEFAAR